MTIDYMLGQNLDRVFVELKPVLLDEKLTYILKKEKDDMRPVNFFTATTDMRDWIGNIRDIQATDKDTFCIVEGVYRGIKRKVKNIKVRLQNPKIGERVMVTEHINVVGGFDLLATKGRLLDLAKPDLNFINIGWSNKEQCFYLRVDPYTGETQNCICGAIR